MFLTDRLPAVLNGDIGYAQTSISLYGSLRTAILAGTYDSFGDRLKDVIAITDIPYKIVTLAGFAAMVYYLWRKRQQTGWWQYVVDYSLLLLFITLTSEIVHQHYLIWLAPTVIWLSTQWWNWSWWLRLLFSLGIILTLFQKYLGFLDFMTVVVKPGTLGMLCLLVCVMVTVARKE